MNQPVGYIYKITNKLNNKIYVGKRQKSEFDIYYWGSGTYISNSIRLHGVENFSREVLEWCYSVEELLEKEKFWISCLHAQDPNVGYNLSEGGLGSSVGGKQNADYFYVHKGIDVKRILKTDLAKYISEGYTRGKGYGSNNRVGKKWDQEVKDKISNSGKGKHNNKGENNPCYGSRFYWANDGVKNKRIPMDQQLPEGFIKGKIQKKYVRTEKQHDWDIRRKDTQIWKGENNPGKKCIGKHWYNNGVKENLFFSGTEPDGWIKGRLTR